MPGRPKVPTKLKILRGEDRPARLNPDEPMPEVGAPEPPAHIIGLSLIEWKYYARVLESQGLVTELDRAALMGLCDSIAFYL